MSDPVSYVYVLHHREQPRFKIGKANVIDMRAKQVGLDGLLDREKSFALEVASASEAHRIEKILQRSFAMWAIPAEEIVMAGGTKDGASEWFRGACWAELLHFVQQNAPLFRCLIRQDLDETRKTAQQRRANEKLVKQILDEFQDELSFAEDLLRQLKELCSDVYLVERRTRESQREEVVLDPVGRGVTWEPLDMSRKMILTGRATLGDLPALEAITRGFVGGGDRIPPWGGVGYSRWQQAVVFNRFFGHASRINGEFAELEIALETAIANPLLLLRPGIMGWDLDFEPAPESLDFIDAIGWVLDANEQARAADAQVDRAVKAVRVRRPTP